MNWPPVIAIHACAATLALLIGPFALWARKGSRGHRAAGYAWVTLMLLTAVSAFFISDPRFPNWAGFSPIHLFIPMTFWSLFVGVRAIVNGQVEAHQKAMRGLYIGACLVAGAIALMPGRRLGSLLWSGLGW